MLLPLLSEADPAVTAEGSLDPLGLYAIADALAVRLVPGVRERQSHPRFLTAVAVAAAVCEPFEDAVAADGVSEPWQVFEWHLVEAMVRVRGKDAALRGLPGRDKAAAALREGVPLSARRYLKTPRVFGFHGVYRTLTRSLEIESAGRLGEAGYELLAVWREDQALPGFYGSGPGPGADWYRRLQEAVRDALAAGAVARKAGWGGWAFLAAHLWPHEFGPREREALRAALLGAEGFRRELLQWLISPEGQAAWTAGEGSERRLHQAMLPACDAALRDLLEAVQAYEGFARALQDAFDDCLVEMTRARGKTPLDALAGLPSVRAAAERVPSDYAELVERLTPYGEASRFQGQFQGLAEPGGARDWAARLIAHHQGVQRGKPPAGKAPWFEQLHDGACLVRPGYRREQGGRHDDSYLHGYRGQPLWSFAADLGLVG